MISVIISTYNRAGFLPACFESLKDQTLNKTEFEIILVDNNCSDNTAGVCKHFSENNKNINFKYFVETDQGLSFARNRGIKESSGDLITFLDDDAYADVNFLSEVVAFMENNRDIASAGGKILLHFENNPPLWLNIYLASLLGYFNFSEKIKLFTKNNYPRGSNMTFRKEIFEKVGLFNTNLGRKGGNLEGSEEKDLFSRVYLNNLKVIFLPQAIVYHVIPEERTKPDFICRQATGIGKSEWNRVKDLGKMEQISRIIIEINKWIASLILFFFFITILKPEKGKMILRFRYWVTKGLMKK